MLHSTFFLRLSIQHTSSTILWRNHHFGHLILLEIMCIYTYIYIYTKRQGKIKEQELWSSLWCGYFEVTCSKTWKTLQRNSLTAKKIKGWKGHIGQNHRPSQCFQHETAMFSPPYSEMFMQWITEMSECCVKSSNIFKYTGRLQNWNNKSKISDFKCDNSPALLRAMWPCLCWWNHHACELVLLKLYLPVLVFKHRSLLFVVSRV